mmetsp:Transcript_115317/g.366657  ORF Transcript_115317/g.366657 Transcript_115317/m.366657 type:complete len:320 (+) Transcript_115317:709-1668(+)
MVLRKVVQVLEPLPSVLHIALRHRQPNDVVEAIRLLLGTQVVGASLKVLATLGGAQEEQDANAELHEHAPPRLADGRALVPIPESAVHADDRQIGAAPAELAGSDAHAVGEGQPVPVHEDVQDRVLVVDEPNVLVVPHREAQLPEQLVHCPALRLLSENRVVEHVGEQHPACKHRNREEAHGPNKRWVDGLVSGLQDPSEARVTKGRLIRLVAAVVHHRELPQSLRLREERLHERVPVPPRRQQQRQGLRLPVKGLVQVRQSPLGGVQEVPCWLPGMPAVAVAEEAGRGQRCREDVVVVTRSDVHRGICRCLREENPTW